MKFLSNKGFIGIILLIIIGAISTIILKDVNLELNKQTIIQLAFGVTLIPGLLWLVFFYLEDKYEKEPIQLLLAMFIAGGVSAFAIAKPLTSILMPAIGIDNSGFFSLFLNEFLIESCIEMLTIFCVVRFTVYFSDEFNEQADGLIYTIAVGLGFAAAYNIMYISSLDAINIGIVITRMITYYLVIAIFSGIMGYFIGCAKFAETSNFNKELKMFGGFILAVFLNAIYFTIVSQIQGTSYNIWTELGVSSVVVIILYAIMYSMLNKAVEASPFKEN